MANIYKIEIKTEGKTPKEIEKELKEILDEIFEEEKTSEKEIEKYCNQAIISFIGVVKSLVANKVFDELADDYTEYMLSADLRTKLSFVKSFTIAVEDMVDDIIGLVNEYKILSKDKNKGNEKKSSTKKELPK